MTRSALILTLSACIVAGGCGSETPADDSRPHVVGLRLVRTLQHGTDAWALAFAPDGRTLATAGGTVGVEATVKLWSTSTWSATTSFPAFSSLVYSLAFTPDGSRLAGSGYDRYGPTGPGVKLWEVPGGRLLWTRARPIPQSLAVSSDGQWVAVASSDEREIEIVALADGALVRRFTAHEWQLLSLAFSADGRYLVSGAADQKVKLWRLPTFAEEATFVGHTAPVWSVAVSADGTHVASGTIDSSVRLWRTSDHSALAVDHQENWVWSVAFSPDGELLASVGEAGLYLYRVSATLEQVAAGGPDSRATRVQFSPDGRYLAAALGDSVQSTSGTIKIWSVDR